MIYTPDKWVVLQFNHNGEITHKVLGGWYGGYLGGDSWRMNSGITEVIDSNDIFIFKGYSGSEYHCNKTAYGMSGLMSSTYASFERQISERDIVKDGDVSMEIIEECDIFKLC